MKVVVIIASFPFLQAVFITPISLAKPLIRRVAQGNTTKSIFRLKPHNQQVIAIAQNVSSPAVGYTKSGIQKFKKQDYRGALADYNLAIQLDKKFAPAYHNRGFVKASKLHDLQGGLDDFNRAIQLDSKLVDAYRSRGQLKAEALRDIQGGLADYNRAIQLDPSNGLTYGSRGILKHDLLNDKSGGIADLRQAARLAQKQGNTENYREAIEILKKWQQDRKN